MGTRAATGGCVVGIDAEPGLHHQGAVWRVVLALIIWGQRRPLGTRSHQHPSRWRRAAHSLLSFLISTHTSANSALLGMGERELFTRALAAGLAVTGSFPGGPQVKRASDAEGLIGGQALDLPCLHAALAGARTRTPGCRKPPVLAVLPLTGLQGRGPGQVGAVAGRSHVELSPQFGHTDDVSTLRARAAL